MYLVEVASQTDKRNVCVHHLVLYANPEIFKTDAACDNKHAKQFQTFMWDTGPIALPAYAKHSSPEHANRVKLHSQYSSKSP